MKDKQRVEVITAVMDGRVEVNEVGKVLERSDRTIFRMVRRMREEGIKGLVHKNRGKESPRKLKDAIRNRILFLARGRYQDVNDTHLKEILLRKEGIDIGRERLCEGYYAQQGFLLSGGGAGQSTGSVERGRKLLG
jgi:transposase